MWEIDYSEEVKNYLRGDLALGFRLMKVLSELMITSAGLPPDNYRETKEGLIRWEVLDHAIYYRKKSDKNEILVTVIKPL